MGNDSRVCRLQVRKQASLENVQGAAGQPPRLPVQRNPPPSACPHGNPVPNGVCPMNSLDHQKHLSTHSPSMLHLPACLQCASECCRGQRPRHERPLPPPARSVPRPRRQSPRQSLMRCICWRRSSTHSSCSQARPEHDNFFKMPCRSVAGCGLGCWGCRGVLGVLGVLGLEGQQLWRRGCRAWSEDVMRHWAWGMGHGAGCTSGVWAGCDP
jgi:hypothetical protein